MNAIAKQLEEQTRRAQKLRDALESIERILMEALTEDKPQEATTEREQISMERQQIGKHLADVRKLLSAEQWKSYLAIMKFTEQQAARFIHDYEMNNLV